MFRPGGCIHPVVRLQSVNGLWKSLCNVNSEWKPATPCCYSSCVSWDVERLVNAIKYFEWWRQKQSACLAADHTIDAYLRANIIYFVRPNKFDVRIRCVPASGPSTVSRLQGTEIF